MEIKNGKILNDKYEVIRKIGAGGTADVYLVKNLLNHKNVVIKVQNKQASVSNNDKRLLLEAQTLEKFDNTNIVKVFEHFEWNGRIVIVMEYLSGKTLQEILNVKKIIASKRAVELTLQILNALKDIHKQNIIHRDLKPENIMVGLDNNLKLMDFGIVQATLDQNLTKQGNVIGTISYMAPEIIRQRKATTKSEIYSLGIVLYQMLTGKLPFVNSDINTLAMMHVNDLPTPPNSLNPNIDSLLNDIVLKMLEKADYERYQSAEELIVYLNNYLTLTDFRSEESRKKVGLGPSIKADEKQGLFKKLFGKTKK